jgi:tRNA threonylcarbamoyladenosine biosynthesis protein TsaB
LNLLAIDTSSLACSVALQYREDVVERHEERAREHTRLLMPMIQEVLADKGVEATNLDAIVLGNGPGSFIGMRIAASVAQGLAHAAGLQIVPVSSLAAVAVQVFRETDCAEVVVAQDAHMNEVYLGAYARDERGQPMPVFPERLQAQTAIEELDEASAGDRIAAGAGWQRYPGLMATNEDRVANTSDVLYPRARFLLKLGEAGLDHGLAISPQDIAPAYLRNKVAEKPGGPSP